MFLYPKQETVNVGGAPCGGQAGTPCLLAGTLFHKKESILREGGGFDSEAARKLIDVQVEWAERTGVPSMVDVFAEDAEHITGRLDFVADAFAGPILADSSDWSVRRAAVEHAEQAGYLDRLVYNSINAGVTPEEVEFLKGSEVSSAIVLAFNPVDNTLKGRLDVLENGGGVVDKGLLEIAKECGIGKLLIDTAVTPVGDGGGSALRSIPAVKAKFGLPTGNGVHNALSSMKWVREQKLEGPLSGTVNSLARLLGADFLLYGPIENAPEVFPAVAVTEAILGDAGAGLGLKLGEDHPLRKLGC